MITGCYEILPPVQTKRLFIRYGILEELLSDNGAQFMSLKLQTFLSSNGVKYIHFALHTLRLRPHAALGTVVRVSTLFLKVKRLHSVPEAIMLYCPAAASRVST